MKVNDLVKYNDDVYVVIAVGENSVRVENLFYGWEETCSIDEVVVIGSLKEGWENI